MTGYPDQRMDAYEGVDTRGRIGLDRLQEKVSHG